MSEYLIKLINSEEIEIGADRIETDRGMLHFVLVTGEFTVTTSPVISIPISSILYIKYGATSQ